MVRVDLFHPWKESLYGTATAADILSVCGGAAMFCGGYDPDFLRGTAILGCNEITCLEADLGGMQGLIRLSMPCILCPSFTNLTLSILI
jgi:hypothetical protein